MSALLTTTAEWKKWRDTYTDMCESCDEVTIEVNSFIESQHDRVISPASNSNHDYNNTINNNMAKVMWH